VRILRWARLGALDDAAANLQRVDLADLALFCLRLPGSNVEGVDGTAICVRFMHLLAQKFETALDDAVSADINDDARYSTSSVTKSTKSNSSVKSHCISSRFLAQPSRGIITAASGGLHPAFCPSNGYDTDAGFGP
jgi:hypothetical protein